jgi:hypothetical protein
MKETIKGLEQKMTPVVDSCTSENIAVVFGPAFGRDIHT